jgi:hypothetical protein
MIEIIYEAQSGSRSVTCITLRCLANECSTGNLSKELKVTSALIVYID